MTRFNHRFRGDRGAADPILTVGAVVVSLIVSVGIVSAIIWIVNLGVNFANEQKTTTNLSQARDAFAKDAQNAAGVVMNSGTQVTFYEPKTGSAVSTRSGAAQNSGCRVSQWTGVPAALNKDTGKNALTNVVWDTSSANCGTDITKTAGVKALSVDGFTSVPQLTAANAAGRALYTNGVKATTIVAKTDTSLTATEWNSTVVKNLAFNGTLTLDITKSGRTAAITGTTRLGDDHALTAPGGIKEPDPAPPVAWAAGAPTPLSASQSSTVGTSLKGYREGLDVSWGAAYCGPYIVKYNVTVTNGYTGTKTYTVTDYAQTHKTSFTGIPNGSKGNVSVTATCPSGKTSAPSTVSYQQKLGTPTLSSVAFAGVDNAVLRWVSNDLSTAPVWFQTQAKHQSQSAWYSGPDQKSASAYTFGWTPGGGYTYGTTNYRVLAHVDGGKTTSNQRNLALALGAPSSGPSVWSYDRGLAIYNNAIQWGSAAGCPAGTYYDYQPVISGSGQGWRQGYTQAVNVRYSTTYSAYVQARCVSRPFLFVGDVRKGAPTSWRTNDPPPPVPNAPGVSGTWQKGSGGGGTTSVYISGVSYATQYEFGSILFGTFGSSGWSSQYVGSSGSYTGGSWCGTGVATSASGRARAGGVSGWSGYSTAELRLTGVGLGCS